MACSNCSPAGCGDKGHCSTGGCNKMNTYDWINTLDLHDPTEYQVVEVSFKNGARKDFYLNDFHTRAITGDTVVVEAASGYDVGQITLSGEMVRLQMKKKNVSEDRVNFKVIRKANERDLEKLKEGRSLEQAALVKSRAIARSLGLEMKLGDVEYQGDLKKATFYYTADGRVDFRELVRAYAKEFRVKIEMRQIGSRQESARIGGLGSCGRELCCSTWLSDFHSVTTSMARYQNISINQTKLSGQCGRLKCCLNYELDTYLDALKSFPENPDYIYTKKGKAVLVKMDIFKGLLYYVYDDISIRGAFIPLDKAKVKEIQALNAKKIYPEDLIEFSQINDKIEPAADTDEEREHAFADVTGEIELPMEQRKRNKKKKKPQDNGGNRRPQQSGTKEQVASKNIGNQAPTSNAKPKNESERKEKTANPPDHTARNQSKNGPRDRQKPHQKSNDEALKPTNQAETPRQGQEAPKPEKPQDRRPKPNRPNQNEGKPNHGPKPAAPIPSAEAPTSNDASGQSKADTQGDNQRKKKKFNNKRRGPKPSNNTEQ